jgi:polyvinyl alcohol dehydrogenase (cytochrome)
MRIFGAAAFIAAFATGAASGAAQEAGSAAPPSASTSASAPAVATEFGFGIFQQHCTACHGNPSMERAPAPAQLRLYTPERILDALTTGPMKSVGDTLTDLQKRQVSESLAGRLLGSTASGDAEKMPNACASTAPMTDPSAQPAWNGWGAGLDNRRYQSGDSAGLDAGSVVRLKVKWVFGLPNSTSSYGQPTVVSGRVFVGSDTGYVYSLDAATGCIYWSHPSQAGVRNAMTIAPISGHGATRYAVFYGDVKANAYALDAETGKQLWTTRVEDHYTDRVTAAPAYYAGRLYVPVSSWEEFAAATPDYPCCTSVGSVVALDAASGRRIWKTYVIASRPRPVRKNAKGVQLWAPAGGSVWNTPTIDPRRHALYFGTGDATTYPAAPTSDSVMALNLANGKVLWTYQVHRKDSFLVGCWGDKRPDNCPKVQGPDWDIPASVILHSRDDKDALLVGTKPGDILALDPDRRGRLLWRVNVHGDISGDAPPGGAATSMPQNTGVAWGGAADADTAYFGLLGGGVAAMRISDGQKRWLTPARMTGGPEDGISAGHFTPVSNGAAVTVIPGVVFVGGSDGRLSAVSTIDGGELWSFDTDRSFESVNKVITHGGSISAPGAVVVGGMVFVGSGYAVLRGKPGNALIAFTPE